MRFYSHLSDDERDQIGLGQYARNQHELLLIGRKGAFPPPQESERVSSVIDAALGGHSEKPAIFAELTASVATQPQRRVLGRWKRGSPIATSGAKYATIYNRRSASQCVRALRREPAAFASRGRERASHRRMARRCSKRSFTSSSC